MGRKGFTVMEMLGVVCVGLFFLILAGVIYQNNVRKVPQSLKSKQVDPTVIDTDPTLQTDKDEGYTELENKIQVAMKKYIENNEYNQEDVLITQSLDFLVENNYLEAIYDPMVSNNQCRGYGLYQLNSKEYRGYLRCPGNYATDGYNPEFE